MSASSIFASLLSQECFFNLETGSFVKINRLRSDASISVRILSEQDTMSSKLAVPHPAYRTSPLKRFIQQELETSIAHLLVKGEFRDGDTAAVDVKDGGVVVVPTVTAK